MKLNDGELVQWNDGTQDHRGRVQRTMGCVVTDSGLSIAALESEAVLVRHSCDGGLEFVPENQLQVQPEVPAGAEVIELKEVTVPTPSTEGGT